MRAFTFAVMTAMTFPTLLTSSQIETHENARVDLPKLAEVKEQPPTLSPEDQDLHCLALNIYHEARSEPESGQIAVAKVTLNRVRSKAFPESVCAVVKQGGAKRDRCQFSWWCDGQSDQPKNKRAWRKALEIARRVMDDAAPDPTGGALYYHANYSNPSWSGAYKRTARIGRHLFYRPRQT